MEITPFSEAWIEGFVNEAADLGLSPEETDALLKQASFMALMQDSSFAEGYSEEMEKSAQAPGIGRALVNLGSALFRGGASKIPLWAGLLGGAAAGYGGYKGLQAIGRHWNRTPEQAQFMKYYQSMGADPDTVAQMARNMEMERMNRTMGQMSQYMGQLRGLQGFARGMGGRPRWNLFG